MKRRTACLVLCVCLLLCLALPAGASDDAAFSDRGEIRNIGAVQMLVDLGLISGYTDGSFRPASYITRRTRGRLPTSATAQARASSAATASEASARRTM